jgi:hypothetical protein
MPRIPKVEETTIKLNLPVEEDPAQEAYCIVRPATTREVGRRAQIGAEQTRILKENGDTEVRSSWVYADLKELEVFLTLCGCNFTDFDTTTEKEVPLFQFKRDGADGKMKVNMSEAEFHEAWGKLKDNWAEALHDAVLQVNKQWKLNSPNS